MAEHECLAATKIVVKDHRLLHRRKLVGHHAPAAAIGMPESRTRQVVSLVPAARTATPIGHSPAPVAFTTCLLVAFHHTAAPWLIWPDALASS